MLLVKICKGKNGGVTRKFYVKNKKKREFWIAMSRHSQVLEHPIVKVSEVDL